ncbi:hypothetical protein WJX74_008876 [Apatococcus lobatus]|uniref:Uncharacterized protein n=1 Tax=Apatococcus lobatus TaxID=904363 RepID=A0AAW1QNF6_9CHLO
MATPETDRSLTDPDTLLALILTVLVGAVCTTAGVGGGAFFVPLFNVLLHFSVKGATALSQGVITAGALAGVALALPRRHPTDPAQPLLQFHLALALTPMLLLGVSTGVLINVAMPAWLVTFLLIALLIYLAHKAMSKGLALYHAEQLLAHPCPDPSSALTPSEGAASRAASRRCSAGLRPSSAASSCCAASCGSQSESRGGISSRPFVAVLGGRGCSEPPATESSPAIRSPTGASAGCPCALLNLQHGSVTSLGVHEPGKPIPAGSLCTSLTEQKPCQNSPATVMCCRLPRPSSCPGADVSSTTQKWNNGVGKTSRLAQEGTRSWGIRPHIPFSETNCPEPQSSSCPPCVGLNQHSSSQSNVDSQLVHGNGAHSSEALPASCVGVSPDDKCQHEHQHHRGQPTSSNQHFSLIDRFTAGSAAHSPKSNDEQPSLHLDRTDGGSQQGFDAQRSSFHDHVMGLSPSGDASSATQLDSCDRLPPQILLSVPCTAPIPIHRKQSDCLIELSPSSFQGGLLAVSQCLPGLAADKDAHSHSAGAASMPERHSQAALPQHSFMPGMAYSHPHPQHPSLLSTASCQGPSVSTAGGSCQEAGTDPSRGVQSGARFNCLCQEAAVAASRTAAVCSPADAYALPSTGAPASTASRTCAACSAMDRKDSNQQPLLRAGSCDSPSDSGNWDAHADTVVVVAPRPSIACSSSDGEAQPLLSRSSACSEARQIQAECRAGGLDIIHDQPCLELTSRWPWTQAMELIALWAIFVSLQVLKAHASRCSITYALLYLAQAVIAICTSVLFIRQAVEFYQHQLLSAAPAASTSCSSVPAGMQTQVPTAWTLRSLWRAAAAAVAAGLIAGVLGVGGGMVMQPLLLGMGLHPAATAATSTLLVLFSSSSAAFSFALNGTINLPFAAVFGLASLLASITGVLVVNRIVQRSGRTSVIVLLLATVMAGGACFTAAFSGRQAIMDLVHGRHTGFHPIC